jgi:peptidoglycan/LPS O-acetylase OafA/YrhL
MNNPKSYRSDIDGLRAIAVSAVVVYHAFPSLLPGGFIGVDIFFVISGFLITGILLKDFEETKKGWLLNFYSRRIIRIFPALLSVIIFCLAFGWFLLFSHEYQALSRYAVGGAALLTNFITWNGGGGVL